MPDPPIKPPNKRVQELKAELNSTINADFTSDAMKIDYLINELAYSKALIEELENKIDEV